MDICRPELYAKVDDLLLLFVVVKNDIVEERDRYQHDEPRRVETKFSNHRIVVTDSMISRDRNVIG